MFGLGFGEILILLVVGIVVVGPKNLPTLMRTAGKWVGKLRRMSFDLRSQSGIDDLIRQEGLEREIQEIRSLSRVNVIDTLMTPAMGATAAVARPPVATAALPAPPPSAAPRAFAEAVVREREYPTIGCDAYGALPDDASPYSPDAIADGEPDASGGASGAQPEGEA